MLERIEIILLSTTLLSGTLRTYQRHACDLSYLDLRCPVHTTIDVLYAHYGRPAAQHAAGAGFVPSSGSQRWMRDEPAPYDPCPPIPGQHETPKLGEECLMPDAQYEILQRVVRDCQHKQQCRLQVAPETFVKTDPCPSTRKYVEVAFKCRPATFINRIVCEGEQHLLQCEANARLAIYSVLFGRTVKGSIQCPQPPDAPDEECQASFATEVVMKACQGKRTCHLVADADRFGGRPCSALSALYMKTVFTCVPRSILKPSFQSGLEADELPQLESTSSHPPSYSPPSTSSDYFYPDSSPDPSSDPRLNVLGVPNKGSTDNNSNRLRNSGEKDSEKTGSAAPPLAHAPSFPFFNPTVKPPPHTKVKEVDELSYRQHDQQQVTRSGGPDLINCTVTILAGSKEREIGFITEWMRAVGFVSRNFEKFTLYLVLGLFCGLVSLLGVVVGRLMLDRRRAARRTQENNDHLTSVFSPEIEDVDGDLDMTVPMGTSTMTRGQSPARASSPLPLPEVVRYNTTPRGIVTIRRQESDIIVPPRSLSRTNNNQLFYS
ncbi:D-galactoside/L-rhamnose binding SUEL lectin domain [Trinorchestia longiramus]|nr:D-galactoside/L-rhamnose binding SUEL lectin domain [Trinorchestia longiramus]